MYLHMGASQNTRYGSIPHRAIHSPRSIPPIIHDTPWFITMLVPCGALWSWLILWFAAGLEDLEGKDSINFMRSWKITLLLPLWHGASGTICCASQVFIAAKYYMCVYADVTWCGVVWYIMNICIHYIRDYIQKFVDSPSYYILPILLLNFVHWSDHTKVVVAGLKEGLKPWKSPKRLASAVFERTRLCIFCRKLL